MNIRNLPLIKNNKYDREGRGRGRGVKDWIFKAVYVLSVYCMV
jgi:hypothetical protein